MKKLLIIFAMLGYLYSDAQYCSDPNSLLSVRKRKVGRTEYVIFTLKNNVTASVNVTNTSPPFLTEGEGTVTNVTGCNYKKVSFRDLYWTCRVKHLYSYTYLVRQVKSLVAFEGHHDYIIGYRCNANSVVHYQYTTGNVTKYVVRFRY